MWQHKTGTYYFGKRSLGTRDKREAARREKILKNGLWALKNGLVSRSEVKQNSPTFKEVAEEYLAIKKQTRKRWKDIQYMINQAKKLFPLRISNITRADIDLAFSEKSDRAKASYYQELRVLFNYAVEKDYCPGNPVPRHRIANRTEILSPGEYEKLLEVISDSHFKLLVQFAYESGCRQSELISPIIWEGSRIIVNGKRGERYIPYKNPLHDLTRFAGLQWPYKRHYVSHKFKEYIREANLSEKYCFETLRHTFGTRLVDIVGIYKTSLYMGHKTVYMTQKYLHYSIFKEKPESEV